MDKSKRIFKSSTKEVQNKKRHPHSPKTTIELFGKKYSFDRENFRYIGRYSFKEKSIQIPIGDTASLSATKNDV